MVRILNLITFLFLAGCTNPHVIYGKEAPAPWGWEYTYCPSHPNEVGCKNLNK